MMILRNRAQCSRCGDVIESVYRHDFRACTCGTIFVDGGKSYLRRGWMEPGDLIELSETAEDDAHEPEVT